MQFDDANNQVMLVVIFARLFTPWTLKSIHTHSLLVLLVKIVPFDPMAQSIKGVDTLFHVRRGGEARSDM